MAYCRFTSDNSKCDLYCYENAEGGFTTHVAATRYIGEPPSEAEHVYRTASDYYRKPVKAVEIAEVEPITLPFAGQIFIDATREELIARLFDLRALGYRFPDEVVERLRAEIAKAAR